MVMPNVGKKRLRGTKNKRVSKRRFTEPQQRNEQEEKEALQFLLVDRISSSVMADVVREVVKMCEEIYATLGGGHTESVYHRALEVELRNHKIKYQSEVVAPIRYKDQYVGYGRADIVIDDVLIVELKSTSYDYFKTCEKARLSTYMESLKLQYGVLINFHQSPKDGNPGVIVQRIHSL